MDSFDSTLGRVDKDRGSRKTDQTNFRSRHPLSTLILQGLLELPIIIEKNLPLVPVPVRNPWTMWAQKSTQSPTLRGQHMTHKTKTENMLQKLSNILPYNDDVHAGDVDGQSPPKVLI